MTLLWYASVPRPDMLAQLHASGVLQSLLLKNMQAAYARMQHANVQVIFILLWSCRCFPVHDDLFRFMQGKSCLSSCAGSMRTLLLSVVLDCAALCARHICVRLSVTVLLWTAECIKLCRCPNGSWVLILCWSELIWTVCLQT